MLHHKPRISVRSQICGTIALELRRYFANMAFGRPYVQERTANPQYIIKFAWMDNSNKLLAHYHGVEICRG